MVYTVDGENYTRRKKIPVTGAASGAQTNYQIKLTALWAAAMQADYDDVRFTKADMQTLIDAWLESKTDSTTADIWAEFPTTPADGVVETEAYMYFGNAGAASDWDMGATFPAFSDDFEDGSVTDWTDAMTTFEASTTQAKHGSYSLKTQSSTWQYGYKSFSAISSPIALDFWIYPTSNNQTRQFGLASASVSDRTNSVYASCHGGGYFGSYDGSTSTNWGLNYNSNQWYHVRLVVYPATDTFDAYVDNMVTPLQTGLGTWGTFGGTIQSFYLRGENSTQYHDTMFIHKYAANPPTYAFGTEEHQRRTPMMM